MSLSYLLLLVSGACYAAAFLMHLICFFGEFKEGNRWAFAGMRLGFLLGTFYFISESVDHGAFLPILNISGAMAFFAWALAFVYLVFLVRIQTESFGVILNPILMIFLAVALISFREVHEAMAPAWSRQLNPYFKIHILSAFFAYASFTLSFAASLLYLIQHNELKAKSPGTFYHKLPSLEELEQLIYRPLLWGLPLLLMTLVVGFFWSKSQYGEYWILDPKTLATIVSAIFYATILYFRYGTGSIRGRQGAVLSVAAFTLVLISFVGIRFIEGSHNYLQ